MLLSSLSNINALVLLNSVSNLNADDRSPSLETSVFQCKFKLSGTNLII